MRATWSRVRLLGSRLQRRTLADSAGIPIRYMRGPPGPSLPSNSRPGFQHSTPNAYNMEQKLSFWRGGTSKGLFILESDLQDNRRDARQPMMAVSLPRPLSRRQGLSSHHRIVASLLGSPDPSGRQLNGLGGGISSLSKAVIIHGINRVRNTSIPQVDYTFLQVDVNSGEVDTSGNCGNLTSAVGPCAVSLGLLEEQLTNQSILNLKAARRLRFPSFPTVQTVPATVDLFNRNTNKVIRSTFLVSAPEDENPQKWSFEPRGGYEMAGLPAPGSEIRLQFLDPGGSKTSGALPTSSAIDSVTVRGQIYRISLVDVSNPGIFIDGRDLGLQSASQSATLDGDDTLMAILEEIRRAGTEMMGLDPGKPSVPKIVLVFPVPDTAPPDVQVECIALSMGKVHKAVPGTLALNLGAACQIDGTIPQQLARQTPKWGAGPRMTNIRHPSGVVEVGARVSYTDVRYVEISRTARCLMQGLAFPELSDFI